MGKTAAGLLLIAAEVGLAAAFGWRVHATARDRSDRGERLALVVGLGALVTLVLTVNALAALGDATTAGPLEAGRVGGADEGGHVVAEDTTLSRQLWVIAETLLLVGGVWTVIRSVERQTEVINRAATRRVIERVLARLVVTFWVAALGLGAVFEVWPGYDLVDLLRDPRLMLESPTTLLAIETSLVYVPALLLARRAGAAQTTAPPPAGEG